MMNKKKIFVIIFIGMIILWSFNTVNASCYEFTATV